MEENNLTPEQYERYIQTVDEFQQLRTLSREEKIKIIDDILKAPFLDLRSDWAFKYVFGGHPDLLTAPTTKTSSWMSSAAWGMDARSSWRCSERVTIRSATGCSITGRTWCRSS